MSDPADREILRARLAEAGVDTTDAQLDEIAAAYPALRSWIAIAEGLAGAPAVPEPS